MKDSGLFISWMKLRLVAIGLLVALYFLGLLYVKFMRYDVYISDYEFNWIPFKSPINTQVLTSYILNLLFFLPLGVLVGLTPKHKTASYIGALALCFLLEILQPIFLSGIFDITTVLLSMAGVIAGFFAYKASTKILPLPLTNK